MIYSYQRRHVVPLQAVIFDLAEIDQELAALAAALSDLGWQSTSIQE